MVAAIVACLTCGCENFPEIIGGCTCDPCGSVQRPVGFMRTGAHNLAHCKLVTVKNAPAELGWLAGAVREQLSNLTN